MDESRPAHISSTRKAIPELNSLQAVADLVELPLRTLTWWVWAFPPQQRYRHFEIAKRSGGHRHIFAPIKPLKEIQRKIATALTDSYRPPPHVHGFTQERSPKTNGEVHVDQRWVFAIDLEDFFPSINFGRVRGLFMAFPFRYPADVATLLARICCFTNALPQGAPTSPIVSNYICRGMDRQLARLAMGNRSYYTRYADDLVFSTDRHTFPIGLASLVDGHATPSEQLTEIIDTSGFVINPAKTRVQLESRRQRVTGLVVNEKVNVPREYLRGLRALLYVWKRYGETAASESLRRASPETNWPPLKPYPGLAPVVRGRVQYVGSIRGRDDPAYLRLAKRLSLLDPDFAFEAPVTLSNATQEAHLYTEGPTDLLHVKAALKYFHGRGEYLNLKLAIDVETPRGNDQKLKEHCEGLGEFGTEQPSVCLFDSDSKPARDAVGPDGWLAYGPNVVAVGLAPPPWRGPHDRLCIELLHPDSILKAKNPKGQRIYQSSEFHPTTSLHKSEPSAIPHAGKGREKERLIQDYVYEVGGTDSIARSKADFARAIEKEPDSFSGLDFEGFRPTLNRIVEALASLETGDPS